MADAEVDFQRIRRVFVLQAEYGTACAACLHGQPLVLPLRGEAESRVGWRDIRRRQSGPDAGLLAGIVVADLAVVQRQAVDPYARLFVLLLAVQQPVPATVAALFEKDYGTLDPHLGEDDVLPQQLRQVDGDFHPVRRDHLFFRGPVRIGEGHGLGLDARQGPAGLQAQFAVDGQYATGLLRRHALYRGAQPVPAENRDEQNRQHDKCKKYSGYPFERTEQRHDGVGVNADNFQAGMSGTPPIIDFRQAQLGATAHTGQMA